MGWGDGHSPPKMFLFLKIEGASGFQTPSEDSLEYYACHKQVWQKMRNYTKQPQVKK